MSERDSPETEKTSPNRIDPTVESLAHKYDPEPRARALQSLLIEEGLLSTEAIDDVIATYEEDIGPLNGAKVVARAWSDPAYKERLLDDGMAAIGELDITVNDDVMEIEVIENTPSTHNIVVCTLCSCYPWAVLGLPPTWYKTPEYRSRVVRDPRGLLADEFDINLDDRVDIEVWDSTSELRYMVLPQQPPDTADLDEAELIECVTRNAMIGADRLA
jgi:nitrile hydratase subunit alpha